MIRGGCACGGIRFEIEAVRSLTHCHCTICRKLTGASFATYAHVEKAKFHWLGGEQLINRYELTPAASAPSAGSVAPWSRGRRPISRR